MGQAFPQFLIAISRADSCAMQQYKFDHIVLRVDQVTLDRVMIERYGEIVFVDMQ